MQQKSKKINTTTKQSQIKDKKRKYELLKSEEEQHPDQKKYRKQE